jgi:hypothetical protein
MAFNVNEFRGALINGGARPSLFQVQILQLGVDTRFMVQAAQIPASVVGVVDVPYFGRKVRVAGDRTYEDWQVTVINDENFSVRTALEDWQGTINQAIGNLRVSSSPESYKKNALVTQYGQAGETIAQYEFVGMFPTNISAIGLDWNNTDQIETFDVTFTFDYWLKNV